MNKAVIISDIHFNLTTLPKAEFALQQAINKANELRVPLLVLGDLHDTKASLRAECVNSMVNCFKTAQLEPIVLVGNHCMINHNGTEHSLNFLSPYCKVIDVPTEEELGMFIPYQNNIQTFIPELRTYNKNKPLFMHQGINSANSDHYYNDPTAIHTEYLAGFTCISGHYHRRQTIKLKEGSFTYVGNPYTLNFGESDHPEKGYHILKNGNILEFIPLNIQKHKVYKFDLTTETLIKPKDLDTKNLNLFKIKITEDQENIVTKAYISNLFQIDNFRLDIDTQKIEKPSIIKKSTPLSTLIEYIKFTNPKQSDTIIQEINRIFQ